MSLWRPLRDVATRSLRHEVAEGFGHSLFSPLVSNAFESLRVAASLTDGVDWLPLHTEPNLIAFELEHGGEADRTEHNQAALATLRRTLRPVRRKHAGFCDLFVPVVARKELVAALVVGPFSLSRPTTSEVSQSFRRLSGREGHPSDPEFAAYLAGSLETLVVERPLLRSFQRLVVCLSELMLGHGRADRLMNEAQSLREKLEPLRFVERSWEVLSAMLDPRSPRGWYSVVRAPELSELGLSGTIDHVAVGLFTSAARDDDPLEAKVRRHEFQRASAELARRAGGSAAGRIGEHGIVFLSAAKGSVRNKRDRLLAVCESARALARRKFGLSLHFGVTEANPSAPLSQSYEAALAAAETALSRGVRLLDGEFDGPRASSPLRALRHELGTLSLERPAQVAAHFERYLELVRLRSEGSVGSARTHLEVGLEQITHTLLEGGAIEAKFVDATWRSLDAASANAKTVNELLPVYRAVIADLAAAVQAPVVTGQQRGVSAAVEYIRQHFTEPLKVTRVAKVAGFTPNYFSELFKQREGKTFRAYVLDLRIERARELLSSTNLPVTRVARLSGFNSLEYFARVFRRTTRATPLAYRKKRFANWQDVRDKYRNN
jgi:AraC-like DNA-binding protein